MTRVKVLLMGELRKKTGWYSREIDIRGDTVEDILKELKIQGEETIKDIVCCENNVKSEYWILINGNEIRREKGLETRVRDGDRVVIMPVMPIMAGG